MENIKNCKNDDKCSLVDFIVEPISLINYLMPRYDNQPTAWWVGVEWGEHRLHYLLSINISIPRPGLRGLTGRLSVSYLRPTPGQPITGQMLEIVSANQRSGTDQAQSDLEITGRLVIRRLSWAGQFLLEICGCWDRHGRGQLFGKFRFHQTLLPFIRHEN